jgi:hypothetical protein
LEKEAMCYARAPAFFFLIAVVQGCTTTRTEKIKTGLFENDPDKMLVAYRKIKPFETTRQQLESQEGGWDFSVDNVKHFGGADALREISEDAFQGIFKEFMQNEEKLLEFWKILNPYSMVRIYYHEVVTTTDRFYLNTKETTRVGRSMALTIVFREDLVVYCPPPRDEKINETTEDYAILQGLLDVIEKYGGFGENIRDAIEKIRDFLEKKKDD